jgi:AcrR family transcriptional regulator
MTEDTRKAILEAALQIVGQGGFESLTIRAIAERAGIGVGTVNYHFGSKAKAIAEAYRFVTSELRGAFTALEDEAVDPAMRLRAFADRFSETVHAHGAALAFFAANSSRDDAPPEYREYALGEGLELTLKVMRGINPGVDAREAAMRLSIFAGGLLYPELVPGAMGLLIDDPSERARYADLAAGMLIPGPDATMLKEKP